MGHSFSYIELGIVTKLFEGFGQQKNYFPLFISVGLEEDLLVLKIFSRKLELTESCWIKDRSTVALNTEKMAQNFEIYCKRTSGLAPLLHVLTPKNLTSDKNNE